MARVEMAGVVVAMYRPKAQAGQPVPDGVVVEVHVQPTPGSGAHTVALLLPREEARTFAVDDEVVLFVRRCARPGEVY